VSAGQWIDKASISLLTLYVAYDAYSAGRIGVALIAAALFIAGIVVELTGGRGSGQQPPQS
jgi:hypothetical protein